MAPAAVIAGAGAKAETARRHRAVVEMAVARVVGRERTLLIGGGDGGGDGGDAEALT